MKLLLVWLLVAEAAFAANRASLSGTVVDSNTRLPVANARVVLRYSSSSAIMATTTSDQAGGFRFDVTGPGNYVLDVMADGYLGTEDRLEHAVVQFEADDFASSQSPVERTITLAATRVAYVSGVLKDGTTQKPLEGFTVKPLRITWLRGKREFHEQADVRTDATGAFRAEVPPGDYVLQIWKAPAPNKISAGRESDYSETFPRTVAYPLAFWPRGDPERVTPWTVAGGVENSAGTIDISKIAVGRLRGAVPRAQCDDEEKVNVNFEMLVVHDNSLRGNLALECGADFTIAGLAPGRYRITAMTSPLKVAKNLPIRVPGQTLSRGQAEMRDAIIFASALNTTAEVSVVEGSDEEIALQSGPLSDVSIQVRCDCAHPLKKLPVPTVTAAGELTLSLVELPEGAPEGMGETRTLLRMSNRSLRFSMKGLPPGIALKEVISNGAATGGIFVPSADSKQTLTVVLTDKAAHLTASVVQDDKPIAGAHVIAARWPLQRVDDFPVYEGMECNPEGKCSMDGVSPADWRIVAVTGHAWDRIDMPGVLEQWLSAGETITLLPGEGRALRLDARQ